VSRIAIHVIEEVRGLLDQYAQWVRDKSVLRELNDEHVQNRLAGASRHSLHTERQNESLPNPVSAADSANA
jgi:hypothetical protein